MKTVILFLSAALLAHATTRDLRSDTHRASVTIDSGRSRVTVKLQKATGDSPAAVKLTLWDENNKPLTMELKALPAADVSASDVLTYTGALPPGPVRGAGSGSLAASRQSYVGIELKIPLSKGGEDTLRSAGQSQ